MESTPQLGALQLSLKPLSASSGEHSTQRAEAHLPAMNLCGQGEVIQSRDGEEDRLRHRGQAETQVCCPSESRAATSQQQEGEREGTSRPTRPR